jgi:FKBP-type peptidyl-prolyl cis-trans isomerase FkpA
MKLHTFFPKSGLFFFLFLLGFTACQKEDPLQTDREKIEAYLVENSMDAERLESGLYYIIEEEGSGNIYPTLQSKVRLYYKGYLLDGTVFNEKNEAQIPPEFDLSKSILGWQQGIPLFREGGKGKLLIPSNLGYGGMKVGIIPPHSVLIFDIELVAID